MTKLRSQMPRVIELKELVRAHNSLERAMYDGDLEALWPKDALKLLQEYEAKYGVDLSGDGS